MSRRHEGRSMFKYFVLGAAAFLIVVTVKAWGFPPHIFWFSIGACAAWVMAFAWAARLPSRSERKHQYWVLVLATLFWWVGEALGLRLGKYQYESLPLTLPLSGTPGTSDVLTHVTDVLRRSSVSAMVAVEGCKQTSWKIPFPVIALEAALLFTMFCVSHRLFKGTDRRPAVATGGLCAVLLINATAVLDPVVSSTEWCGMPYLDPLHLDSNLHGLMGFRLWHWFTNVSHPGFWFGVPLVNYAAWFLTALVFGFVTRVREDSHKGYDVREAVVALSRFFLYLIPLKLAVDWVLIGLPRLLFGQVDTLGDLANLRIWQLCVMALLVIGGFALIRRGKGPENPDFNWFVWVPQIFVLVFCGAALMLEWNKRILAAEIVAVAFLVLVMTWPGLIARLVRRPAPPAPAPAAHG
jgi:hypothetical protein